MMRVLESFAEVVESTNTKFISQHKHWQKLQSKLNFCLQQCYYHIHGIFDGDSNLVVWPFLLHHQI